MPLLLPARILGIKFLRVLLLNLNLWGVLLGKGYDPKIYF